jgi:hypothetical protein
VVAIPPALKPRIGALLANCPDELRSARSCPCATARVRRVACCTLRVARCMLRGELGTERACCPVCVVCCALYVARRTSRVACRRMWHATRHTLRSACAYPGVHCILHDDAAGRMLHVACCVVYVACRMLRVACSVVYVACRMLLHAARCSPTAHAIAAPTVVLFAATPWRALTSRRSTAGAAQALPTRGPHALQRGSAQ